MDKAIKKGINVVDGKVTYRAVGEALGHTYTSLDAIIVNF